MDTSLCAGGTARMTWTGTGSGKPGTGTSTFVVCRITSVLYTWSICSASAPWPPGTIYGWSMIISPRYGPMNPPIRPHPPSPAHLRPSKMQDPNSLSNLDQDLPNFAQHDIPIHSLPAEWLWCETWYVEFVSPTRSHTLPHSHASIDRLDPSGAVPKRDHRPRPSTCATTRKRRSPSSRVPAGSWQSGRT